jgi:hypothetical protein
MMMNTLSSQLTLLSWQSLRGKGHGGTSDDSGLDRGQFHLYRRSAGATG